MLSDPLTHKKQAKTVMKDNDFKLFGSSMKRIQPNLLNALI